MTGRDLDQVKWCDGCETYHPPPPKSDCRLGKQFDRMAAKIDKVLNRQGLMSAAQKNRLRTDLATKVAKKQWHSIRTEAELEIHKLMPHYGCFIERKYFEEDETYSVYPMYALFHVRERLSPWYYHVPPIRDWVKANSHVIMAYLQLQHQLLSQRSQNEKLMRMAP